MEDIAAGCRRISRPFTPAEGMGASARSGLHTFSASKGK